MDDKVNVLGTEYSIVVKAYKDEPKFEKDMCDGWCSFFGKMITIVDKRTCPGWENESIETCNNVKKQILRHEIVHAFLQESGLSFNASEVKESWATNEEMVDWFAIQGTKIHKAWQDAECV